MTANQTDRVVFEASYGVFRGPFMWLIPALGVLGLMGVAVGIFGNEGWKIGNTPLEPWSARVIIEIFAVGALLLAGSLAAAMWRRRTSPQRVALTESSLIVPKGMFSDAELVLPRSEINVKIFNAGFVKQIQILHKRRKILLSSAMFPTNEDFDHLADELV